MTLDHPHVPARFGTLAALVAVALSTPTVSLAQGVFRIDGESDVPLFGRHIMPLGDCDGDGVVDYGVEAADTNGSLFVDRSLRVVSGATGTVLWSGPLLNGAGSPVATSVGDVNGDGSDDVAYAYHLGDTSRVRIASGMTGALIRELPNLMVGTISRVQTIRDLNGDGALDVLVHSGDNSPNSPGIFQLFSGATGVRINEQSTIRTDDALLIDAPTPGQVKIVTRTFPMRIRRFDLTQAPVVDLDVSGPDPWVLGLEPIGDINGDGWGDVLCRSSTAPTPGPGASRVSVLSGETLEVLWDAPFEGPTVSQRFVVEKAVSVGDQNGDGVADVALQLERFAAGVSRGRLVRVLSGRNGVLLRNIESFDSFTAWAADVASVGDMDGDGVHELGVCAAYSKLTSSGLGATSQVFLLRSSEVPNGMQGLEFCRIGPANSTGEIGQLAAVGSAAVPAGTLTFHATELPTNTFGLLIVSARARRQPTQPGSGLCLGGLIGRYRAPGQVLQTNGMGEASLAIDGMQIPLSLGFVFPMVGNTFAFQVWHRDAGLGGAVTSRFTSGVTITFR